MELESTVLPGVEAKRPIVIAGPCSAETEEQGMDTAKQLAAKGQKIYRAGIWKPRTKPGLQPERNIVRTVITRDIKRFITTHSPCYNNNCNPVSYTHLDVYKRQH